VGLVKKPGCFRMEKLALVPLIARKAQKQGQSRLRAYLASPIAASVPLSAKGMGTVPGFGPALGFSPAPQSLVLGRRLVFHQLRCF